jgi:hypothetical protein
MTIKIGEFQSEKDVKENQMSRDIVKEILRFGVNDRMILLIIHQLAMNLESNENMRIVTETIRELNSNTFLIDRAEEQEMEENKLII